MNASRMVTEVVLETGWSIEYVLNMPARRFFSFKKHLVDLKKEKELARLLNACDIQAISWGGGDYLKEIKRNYREMLSSSSVVRKKLALKVLDADNKADTDIVASNLKAAFDVKARLMGIQI